MTVLESSLPLWIVLFPVIGFIINSVVLPLILKGFHKSSANLAGTIATIFVGISFVLSLKGALIVHELQNSGSTAVLSAVFNWFDYAGFKVPFSFRLDALSSLMTLIVTGVGTLIHIYSIGYMAHDKAPGRFFSYLNLFIFAMLMLVLGDNLVMLFFGWEGVGLCSYLLIGFWYTDTEKANAGVKAFVTNRIGDLGFLVGMFLLYQQFGTLTISEILEALKNPEIVSQVLPSLSVIGLALFVGATGKSAQIPLYVWLPDAMAGPTPVSALIHAATMVTAGVYMIARLSGLFELIPNVLSIIAHIGAFTALFAGTIAIAQTDIKKVLAYSTVSQLGYMFLACGVGAYQTAVFHLMTHAFFKALLFLGSGSVIHACSGEQNMLKMGGLKKYLPHTYRTMLIGSLAISGIPLFAGFFSKDEILYSVIALPNGYSYLFVIGVITAMLTAFYTARLLTLTFYGKERLSHDVKHHLHESPAVMTIPLYVLAGLATVGGFLGVPHLLGGFLGHIPHVLSHWLAPIVPSKELPLVGIQLPLHEGLVMVGSVILAIISFWGGLTFFKNRFFISDAFKGFTGIHKVLENKYYIDELYQTVIIKPLQRLSDFSNKFIDRVIIDGSVNGIGKACIKMGHPFSAWQAGSLQWHVISMLIGLAGILGLVVYLLIEWKGF